MVRAFRIGAVAMAVLALAGAVAAQEIPVLTTPAGEFQPARGPNHLAWEQNTKARPKHYDVFVQPDGGSPIKVNGGRSNGAMGGIDGDLLVYQEFWKRKSDLFFFNLTTGQRSRLPKSVNSRHWEYWPSLSDPWLLFARWNTKQGWRRLFLLHMGTGERRDLHRTRSDRAFIGPGQVNGDFAVWSTCPPRGRCHVYRYHIATGSKVRMPNPGAYQRAPSVTPGGTVFYARGGRRCGAGETLVRSPIEGPETILVQLPEALSIGDTYAFTQPNGSTEIFFDRSGCGRPAASDIMKVREPALATLTVVKEGPGGGTASSDPPGIQCGLDCSEDYEVGTTVTLTATPDLDSAFLGWSGDCTGAGDCVVTLDGPRSVTATFLSLNSITIVKDALPDDPQDFQFFHEIGGFTFSLDDDDDDTLPNTKTFTNVALGTYNVAEVVPDGWELTDLDCTDPDGGTIVDLETATATIDLDTDEAIICTFTNTKEPSP